jgi:hypothetical protein
MSIHVIHRFLFDQPALLTDAKWADQTPDFLAIEPVQCGLIRFVMQSSGAKNACFVFSRTARTQDVLPQDFYRWWKVELPEKREGVSLFRLLLDARSASFSQVSEDVCVLDLGGGPVRLNRINKPLMIYGDPRRLSLASDPTFEVDAQNIVDAISTIRGRGKMSSNGAMVDVVMHAVLPVRDEGRDLAHVRVLTFKRADNQSRVDVVAKCSEVMLESSGFRVSLGALTAVLQNLRGVLPERNAERPLLSVGFDLDARVVWVGRADPSCAAFSWKYDDSMQAMSARSRSSFLPSGSSQ